MRKITFLKSLFVAVCLLVGGNAWADDVYTSVYTRAAVGDWTTDDKTDWNASSAVEINTDNGLGANANLTATYVNKSFAIGAGNKVKYEVDWVYATATGRTSNWNWIQFGDFLRIAVNSSYNMQVSTDGGSTWNATALGYYKNNTFTKHISLIINTANNTIESFLFDGTDYTSLVSGLYSGKTFNSVSTGFVRGGSVSWTLANYIKTITVSQAEQSVSYADYTINYKSGGSIVKTVTGNVTVGTSIPVDTDFWVGDVKYKTNAGEPTTLVVADGGSSLDVAVSEASLYSYTIKTKDGEGNELQIWYTGNLYEGESLTLSYPQYMLAASRTTLYQIAANGSGDWYRKVITPDKDGYEDVLVYNDEPVKNVAYYTEAEEIPLMTSYDKNTNRASNGRIAHSGGTYCDVTTLGPGKYKVFTRSIRSNSNTHALKIKCGETVVGEFAVENGTNIWKNTDEFTVLDNSTLAVSSEGSSTAGLDFLYVVRTELPVTIGPAGWATLYTPYTLDFSSVAGLTAYTATRVAESVILNKVDDVPDETGVVLQGAPGTYNIPVIESSATLRCQLTGNATSSTEWNEFSSYGYTIYILVLNDAGDKVYFSPCTSGEIAAGKAFLMVKNTSSSVKELSVVFDDEATGIESAELTSEEGAIFDLQGRKVTKATRGLYIVNGKKVFIK